MPNITIYSTPTCAYCKMTKDYLNSRNIPFTDIDVSADQSKAQEMYEKSGQFGVPVIDVDGTVIIGFDKKKLEELLPEEK
jgi:glutaredoxin-like YruB-family protein